MESQVVFHIFSLQMLPFRFLIVKEQAVFVNPLPFLFQYQTVFINKLSSDKIYKPFAICFTIFFCLIISLGFLSTSFSLMASSSDNFEDMMDERFDQILDQQFENLLIQNEDR